MPRPRCCRRVAGEPVCRIFKPVAVPLSSLEEIVLSLDELEAIRLADLEGLYHEQAAAKMNVSRQTFGRILDAARAKVARVLVKGHALRIEGGEIEVSATRVFRCEQCEHTWDLPYGVGRPAECPACKSRSFRRCHGQQGQEEGMEECPRK